uniref:Tudor domain-containing protein n=1 Tax=Scleropages formosus TaxID=113540 RepID=A0A8C9TFS4_SCLFO
MIKALYFGGGQKKVTAKYLSLYLQWTLGSRCRAVWSDDGLVYPAVLVWAEGQRGRVLFDVYGNEEELELSALLPPEEQEPSVSTVTEVTTISIVFNRQLRPLNHKLIPFLPFCSRKFTLVKHHMVLCPLSLLARLCSGTWMAGNWRGSKMGSQGYLPFPPPSSVLPPRRNGDESSSGPDSDVAELSSMLLSWYLCGYHTGYYMSLSRHHFDALHLPRVD